MTEDRNVGRLFILLCVIWLAVLAAAFALFRMPYLAEDANVLSEAAPFLAFALAPPIFLGAVLLAMRVIVAKLEARREP